MSILIKGMNMPSSCQPCKLKRFAGSRVLRGCKPEVLYECPFCDGLFALKDKRNPSCKFEQFPTPHGDLIDRDHLLDILDKIILKPDSYAQRCMAMATKRILIHQTPVIKAEGKS